MQLNHATQVYFQMLPRALERRLLQTHLIFFLNFMSLVNLYRFPKNLFGL